MLGKEDILHGRETSMVTPKQIAQKAMTPEKKAEAKNDIFAYYIGRPISYVLTVPFLALGIKPNTVSLISFFPSVVGFLLLGFGKTVFLRSIGVLFFILWNFMDGVDGNIARYTKQTSTLGTLWDAASGYFAMMLMYFAIGISVMNTPKTGFDMLPFDDYVFIVLSGLTSIFTLYSRLVMHKKMLLFSYEAAADLQDKGRYSGIRLIALNLTSPSGFMQVIMLLAVIFGFTRYFVVIYFLIYLAATLYSMIDLLKE